MDNHYVACDLGADGGHIVFGTLRKDELSLGEAHHFPNEPVEQDGSLQWNIPQLYHETLEGLKVVGSYEENIDSISCNSWGSDYLLFGSDGSLITPTYHHADRRWIHDADHRVESLEPGTGAGSDKRQGAV